MSWLSSCTPAANESTSKPDILDPLKYLQPGYPKLAGRMGLLPEQAIFKQFGALNAKKLLYMQSELLMLEQRLQNVEVEDAADTKDMKRLFANDFYYLRNSEYAGPDTRQLNLVKEMRILLKEYNHALIQQQSIYQMKSPSQTDIEHVQNYLTWMYSPLMGLDHKLWGTDANKSDFDRELVVLRPREGTDIFSRWLGHRALEYLTKCGISRFKTTNPDYGSVEVKDENMYRFTFVCTSIIASLSPVFSFVVLVFLNTLRARIIVNAAFNVAISLLLTMFTGAKRTDVFAVSAAFTAIQVVFVGQALSNGPQEITIAASVGASACICKAP